jgi:hypothetical protein
MAAVDNRHPSYLERLPEWQMLRASLRGSQAIKEGGEIYLPCSSISAARTTGPCREAAHEKDYRVSDGKNRSPRSEIETNDIEH